MGLQLDTTIVSAIIVGIPTTILAIITFFYMLETKAIRQSSQFPVFSVAPTSYTLGGSFHRLLLLNSGHMAKSIRLDCKWTKPAPNEPNCKNFFIVSIGSDSRAILDGVPIAAIVQSGAKLEITISCKDSKNKDYSDKLEMDFGTLTTENRAIAYQDDSSEQIAKRLERISDNIKRLE